MTKLSDEMTNSAPVQSKMIEKLRENFQPSHIELINESHMHNVPANSETHFKLVMVSGQFDALSRVRRHQAVYSLFHEEMSTGVHALALHLYSDAEWAERGSVPASPQCLGGSKS